MKKTFLCILVAALIMEVVMPTVQAQNNSGAKKTVSNTTNSATKANKPTKLVVAGYNDDFTLPEFDGSGKDITIDVTTTASSYTVTQLPSWCSIGDKQSGEFTLHVNANGNSTPRRGAFFVNAGDKTIAVIVSQKAATITSYTPSTSSTLSTIPTSSSSANNITSSYANFKKLALRWVSHQQRLSLAWGFREVLKESMSNSITGEWTN